MHGQNENKYSKDIAILENHEYLATALKICKIMQYVMIDLLSIYEFSKSI